MAITGRAVAVAAACVLVVLAQPGAAALATVDGVLVVVLLADVALAGSVRALQITRSGATTVRQGEPVVVHLEIRNGGRRTVRALVRDAWPPSAGSRPRVHRVRVGPGERRRLSTTLVPTRRGDRRPERLTVRSLGPLGLAGRQGRHVSPWQLRVLPAFAARRHLPELLRRLRQVEGLVAARGAGRGSEFDMLREYVPGDDVRTLDWRASARRDVVVVRTYRPERDRRVIVVIDTGRTSAGRVGDAPRLDHYLDATLLLASLAHRAGDRVDLLAHDALARAQLQSATLPGLMQVTATLEPALLEVDHAGVVSRVLASIRRRALVVLLTDLNAAVVEESLLSALGPLTARHTVLLAAVEDPQVSAFAAGRGDVDAVYRAGAAERSRTERRRLAALLRRIDVEVVDAPPDRFPAAVCEAYLALKAAGRL